MMAGPVLSHIGYGLSWQNAVILCWGGLRGAVGLALALQVALDYNTIGSKVNKYLMSRLCQNLMHFALWFGAYLRIGKKKDFNFF